MRRRKSDLDGKPPSAPDTAAARSAEALPAALSPNGQRPGRTPVMPVDARSKPRMKTPRKSSPNSLDRAGGDPNVRFVIIALALFFMALIFVVISRFIE